MKYLFIPPKNKSEKKALQSYVKAVEKEYKGIFVYGEESKTLLEEVHEALIRSMKAKWQNN